MEGTLICKRQTTGADVGKGYRMKENKGVFFTVSSIRRRRTAIKSKKRLFQVLCKR